MLLATKTKRDWHVFICLLSPLTVVLSSHYTFINLAKFCLTAPEGGRVNKANTQNFTVNFFNANNYALGKSCLS